MLMMLTPSRPSLTNTTTMAPRMLMPIATQRFLELSDGRTSVVSRRRLLMVGSGYLWSPKRNANGARNPFYESMREVVPGDLVFSFIGTRIYAVGVAQSYCWES
jgi:hypothetical protein